MGPGQRRRPRVESEGEAGMMTTMELLRANEKVSGFKINVHKKESMELFFVKGKLETVRCTDTCDKEVTEQNQLLYVKKGTTDISIKPAYIGAGAFLIFVGFAFAVPYYDYLIETSKGRKQKNER